MLSDILKDIGIKRTNQRMKVLNLLYNSKTPLTAEEIHLSLCDNSISLSTVYRTLELFSEKNVVVKSSILDSDKYYYELLNEKHQHHVICLNCKKMCYIDICPIHNLKVNDFEVTGHKLEVYGYCKACKEDFNKK